MAINQNHLFEELDGVKCAIVEKNVQPARVGFLKRLLEFNRYTVIVVPSPPPKAAPSAAPKPAPAPTTQADPQSAASPVPTEPSPPPPPAPPVTFTVGVTDVTFNPVNAIFGRLLKAPGGHTVTLAYWQQKENIPDDETPYFEAKS